jgi:hypothetical protein
MRLFSSFCLLALVTSLAQAQTVKATRMQNKCETLCAELFTAIRANPEKLVMRVEEALVINESCVAEIVTAAMDAVNAEPAQVRKIVEAAMEVSPAKSAMITAAVQRYSAPELVAIVNEEVRPAELPDLVKSKALPGEEVRRAELPLTTRSIPIVEVRRAELPAPAASVVVQQRDAPFNLMNVPKAKPLK